MEELDIPTPTEIKTPLRDKRVADITVGDAMKATVLVTAATLGTKLVSNIAADKVKSVARKLRSKVSKKSSETNEAPAPKAK